MNHISKYFSALAGLALSAASVLCVSGCEDKIETEGPKDLYEVIVNKPVVRIGQNETVEVRIILGNEDYSVWSYDTEIAGASVSGDVVTITSGSRNGATTVTVTDCEGVSADISVNVGLFELELSTEALSLEPEESRDGEAKKGFMLSFLSFSMGNLTFFLMRAREIRKRTELFQNAENGHSRKRPARFLIRSQEMAYGAARGVAIKYSVKF